MSNPTVFNVLTGQFQSYEEFFGKPSEEKKNEMTRYKIFAGLSGGFGGEQFRCVQEFTTKNEAEDFARQCAFEEYEGYGGMHGLYTEDSMREELIGNGDYTEEELDNDSDIVTDAYNEDIENWIDYHVEKCNGDCCNCNEEYECNKKDIFGNSSVTP